MTTVPISSNGRDLAGNFFVSAQHRAATTSAALLIHGWQSAQDRMFDLAELLSQEMNIACLTFDLGGHGNSSGEIGSLSRQDFLADVITAYDFLSTKTASVKTVGVIGSSFGGYLAALLTAQREIDWLVMRVPADYPDDGFTDTKTPSDRPKTTAWRAQKKSWEETAALRAIHNFDGKILIVESELDDLIPHQTIQNYIDAVRDKKKLKHGFMKGAPHSLTRYPDLKKVSNQIVLDWLKEK